MIAFTVQLKSAITLEAQAVFSLSHFDSARVADGRSSLVMQVCSSPSIVRPLVNVSTGTNVRTNNVRDFLGLTLE